MASYLTETQIATLTGAFIKHFETFAAFNSLAVHKEPVKIVVNVDANVLPGYGTQSNDSNFTLVPVSGVFRAMVVNERNQGDLPISELQARAPGNKIKIKVEKDAYDFITNGKTELFELNGIGYNGIDNVYVQNYLGAKYYIFELKSAN